MAAILLSGEQEKYVFSVMNTKQPLPAISGFYILIKSPDKYGIRDREFLAIGYSRDFSKEKTSIEKQAPDYTHIYLMPDFEREPEVVLRDIERTAMSNAEACQF